MDCYPKANTSPFVQAIDCPSTCPDTTKLQSHHCYWDEALFDCLQDFSNHSSRHHSSDFRVNTEASYYATSLSGTTSAASNDAYYRNNNNSNNNEAGGDDIDNPHHHHHHHDEGYGGHAALHYEDVEDAGPPARPQEFPTPFLHEGTRTTIRAMDHRTQNVRTVKNVLLALCNLDGSMLPNHLKGPVSPAAPSANLHTTDRNVVDRAYLLKKRISKSPYGNCYLSVVLQRRDPRNGRSRSSTTSTAIGDEKRPEEDWNDVEWESTESFVTITVSPWSDAMRRHRRSLSLKREGPLHAIAAMQHVGNYHPHVMGLVAVFADEQHLYVVTPFHGGIDLQTKIVANREQGHYKPNEVEARVIFKQLLHCLFHLQRKGVCHSNLSLENIYIDRNNQNLVVVDLGRSFRVPYNDPSNFGCLTGETEGTTRRLLQLLPQDFGTHPTENLMYLSPEIIENESAFDGFAADLWAAACILFVLLVGMAPFKTAHYWDAAYAEISSGNLKGLLNSLNIHLSEEAIGLLQNMFWRDPRDRLTLAQILDHAWVKNQRLPSRPSTLSACTSTTTATTASSLLPRNMSNSRLSNADSTSTTSSFCTKDSDKARWSTGSRKSLSKALTGLFGGGSKELRDNSNSTTTTTTTTSSSKGWAGLLLSNSSNSRHSSSSGSKTRRASLGGLSSAASSATNTSPASLKSVTATAGAAAAAAATAAEEEEEEEKQDAFGFQVLQLPSL